MTGAGDGSLKVAGISPEISARSLASTLVTSQRKTAHGGTVGVVKQRPSEARVSLKSGEVLSLSIATTLDPIDLWNKWPWVLAFVLVLAGEWVLRKRRGLL